MLPTTRVNAPENNQVSTLNTLLLQGSATRGTAHTQDEGLNTVTQQLPQDPQNGC